MKIEYKNDSQNLILLVHGFSGYPRNSEYLAERLNETLKYDILVPQLPGHNQTLSELKKSRFESWIKKIRKTIDDNKNKYENIYLIGFSMGTLIVTILSDEYEKVKRMVLIAPPFAFPIKKEILLFLAPVLKPIKKYHYKDIGKNKLNNNIYDEKMRKKYPAKFEKEPIESIIEFNKLRNMAQKKYKTNTTPFLVIQSTEDRVATYDENYKFLKKNRGPTYVRFVNVENSGHMIPLDYDRDKIAVETKKFLEEDLSWEKI